jgi:hypothetical protein
MTVIVDGNYSAHMHDIKSDFGSHLGFLLIKPNAVNLTKKWMIPLQELKNNFIFP